MGEASKLITDINPHALPTSVRHGIAPAKAADARLPYWGPGSGEEGDAKRLKAIKKHLKGFKELYLASKGLLGPWR